MASAPSAAASNLSNVDSPVSDPNDKHQASFRNHLKAKIAQLGSLLMKHSKFIGPGIMTSVAYFDPGNWATGIAAGSANGYSHLFVVLLAGMMGIFLQVLACRLGVVSGLDLAQQCRAHLHNRPKHKLLWRWGACYPLYVICEIAIIFTDLAELLGSAVAITLIFPVIPLHAGVILTSFDVLIILTCFSSYPSPVATPSMRVFEFAIAALVITVLVSFMVLIFRIGPVWEDVFRGYVPSDGIFKNQGLFNAVGIVGATVMPHAIFLGSKLATTDRMGEPESKNESRHSHDIERTTSPDQNETRPSSPAFHLQYSEKPDGPGSMLSVLSSHVGHGSIDLGLSLFGCALVINSAILIFAAASFYYGREGEEGGGDLFGAFDLIKERVGDAFAILFAVALLISGQLASITATLSGQVLSEGFLEWRIKPWQRRLITRLIGIVPSLIIAVAVGRKGIDRLLVISQVALSIALPFVIVPLLYFTSSKTLMSVNVPSSDDLSAGIDMTTGTAANQSTTIPWRKRMFSFFSRSTSDASASKMVKEVETVKEVESGYRMVSFANHPLVIAAGVLIFSVICVANVYALVQLGTG